MTGAEWTLGGLLLLAAATAFAFGGGRERVGAAMLAAVSGASLLLPDNPRLGVPIWVLLLLDLGAVVLLARMSWKAPRPWPVFALAAEAVAAAATLAFIAQSDVTPETYLRALLATRYVAAGALLIGACRRPLAQP